jgi:hypothetical protein
MTLTPAGHLSLRAARAADVSLQAADGLPNLQEGLAAVPKVAAQLRDLPAVHLSPDDEHVAARQQQQQQQLASRTSGAFGWHSSSGQQQQQLAKGASGASGLGSGLNSAMQPNLL